MKQAIEVYKLHATVPVRVNEIEDELVTDIVKLVAKGKKPALWLEGMNGDTGFISEREIVSPVTKVSLTTQINDLRTSMEDTPLPWTLRLIYPYIHPESKGIRIQSVATLAEFGKPKRLTKKKKAA